MSKTAEIEFARGYEPSKSREAYAWVLEFARETLVTRSLAADALDNKAESLRRYVGTVLVGFSAALLFLLQSHPLWIFVFFPALVGLVTSAVMSGSVSRPMDFPALPRIERALAFAEHFGAEGEVRFYAFAVPLQTKLDALLESKARWTKAALRSFNFALVSLLLAVMVVALNLAGVIDLKTLLERG